ncbi:hypothetical protein [Roseateles sp. NT4]|uniref:hypothetical protein n=1 Tax=Roseateles sp. NT4 TaxID=3453715 RepID=UPI003F7041D7
MSACLLPVALVALLLADGRIQLAQWPAVSAAVGGLLLLIFCWLGVRSVRTYLTSRAEASPRSLAMLYDLVLADARSASYVRALIEGCEPILEIDCDVATHIAAGWSAAPCRSDFESISYWTFSDWHYGVPYTRPLGKQQDGDDASKGRVGQNI